MNLRDNEQNFRTPMKITLQANDPLQFGAQIHSDAAGGKDLWQQPCRAK